MKTKLFLTGLAIMAATTMMSAQTAGNSQKNGNGKGSAYVDNNKDGVCDNYQSSKADVSVNRGNCDGTGKGKGKSNGQGKGRNFVDANKNGVCDNYEARTKK